MEGNSIYADNLANTSVEKYTQVNKGIWLLKILQQP